MVSPTALKRAAPFVLWLAYAATVASFLWIVSSRHLPDKGFTALLIVGDKTIERAIAPLRELQPYTYPDSVGYDGQYYAQLAMNPDLGDPALENAIDNLPFRARRMLISWICWAAGGGDPARALFLYSTINIACWLALALLLLRWFPPAGWQNFLRWTGLLLTFGLCYSVRAALLDGPSLLSIAGAVALYERRRLWSAAVLLGFAGLIRETNILAAVVLLPLGSRERKPWRDFLLQGAIAAAPILLWSLVLAYRFGLGRQAGEQNLTWPFVGLVRCWTEALTVLFRSGGDTYNSQNLLCLTALTVQAAYLALRPDSGNHWWRLGAAMLLLMGVLGTGVWAGYPISATRVLLPMALAFNVLVPRGAKWLPVLLLGNITLLSSFAVLGFTMSTPTSHTFSGTRRAPTTHPAAWEARFDANWFPAERSAFQYWRWAGGDARIEIVNPLPVPVRATVRFGLKSRGPRFLAVSTEGITLWSGTVGGSLTRVELASVTLAPGANDWLFAATPPAPVKRSPADRGVVFSVRDLEIEILGPATAATPPPPPGDTSAP